MPEPGDSSSLGLTGVDRLVLHVQHDAGEWTGFGDIDGHIDAARRALAQHNRFRALDHSEACVALSDDATVRRLNAQYRGKDKPTNVLSFPSLAAHSGGDGEMRLLGDLVVAEETVLREAKEQGVPPSHHLQHLVVHGVLHLLGFDHETEADARDMEDLEVSILSSIGVANPYADELAPAGGRMEGRAP